MKDWSISLTRTGWGSWACWASRRDKCEEGTSPVSVSAGRPEHAARSGGARQWHRRTDTGAAPAEQEEEFLSCAVTMPWADCAEAVDSPSLGIFRTLWGQCWARCSGVTSVLPSSLTQAGMVCTAKDTWVWREKAYSAELFPKSSSLFSIKSFKITANFFFVNIDVKQAWFEVKGLVSFIAQWWAWIVSFGSFEQDMILRWSGIKRSGGLWALVELHKIKCNLSSEM